MAYESYKARINSYGGNAQKSMSNITKHSQRQMILNSPTRKTVKINDLTTLNYCIVSDVDTYLKRRFLFLPDFTIDNGDYIQYEGFTYLVTERKISPEFPEAIGELCNFTFPIVVAGTKTSSGVDDFGRPISYTTNDKIYNLSCVLKTKDNLTNSIDNSPIPLLEGTMTVKMKYFPNIIPKINYEFTYRNEKYQVVNIFYDGVINEKGFIEVRLNKVTWGDV